MTDEQIQDTAQFENSRAPFEPLGFREAPDDSLSGSAGNDVMNGDPTPASGAGLPGALAFWRFDDPEQGSFNDTRGGPHASAFRLVDHQAIPQAQTPTRAGPDGAANTALEFNGEDSFGFIAHDDALEVTQGTVSLWIQPDDLSHDAIILSKDQSGTVDGGHFRLGIEDGGRIFLRFAEGDGGSNKAWVSSKEYFKEGIWTHVAVSFTEDGITVYADGVAVPDYAWIREEGNLDSPALASEAYILQNQEPWLLGTNTASTHDNESPEGFAAETGHLCDPFDGAIADFGFWGGFTPQSALNAEQVLDLFVNGPGTALTAPAGPQPMLAGNDTIDGGDGNDVINGDAGNDELLGGNGEDSLMGGHGDDVLDGGAGNDVLQGGRGADLLIGGDGDDLLVSRSDAGEQRIGQLAIGEPTRGDPDNEVNPERQKLYGWEDQPLIADDILVGGDGADTFLFNPQINAKRDIILEHVNDDRTIDWAGVAGENNELHDHWVDNFGIDVIADYNATEDTIAIIGHTVNPQVEYKLIDTDGDGIEDEAISVISVYSNQGGGGGAHTQDLIGQIVVHGDLVDPDNIVREAAVTHGIVETVDELQEALAPSGQLKVSLDENGNKVFGYDTRDAEGNLGLITANPEDHIDNPFLDDERFDFATNVPDGTPEPVAVIDALSHPALGQMVFTGNPDDGQGVAGSAAAFFNIPHEDQAAGLAQTTGTFAFNFTADSPGGSKQTLFSKDASGYVDGGHLTAWVTADKHLLVRYQSTDETVYLQDHDNHVEAGQSHHFAFSFDGTTAKLFVDGELRDTEDLSESSAFANGMFANTESLVFGAGTTTRTSGQLNNLKEFFDGNIEDVVVADRALLPVELFKLQNADGDFSAIGLVSTHPVNTLPDQDLPADEPETDTPTPRAVPAAPVAAFEPTTGTDGDDTINGTAGNDVIDGARGEDHIIGGDGFDTLRGGNGDDKLEGGDGNDNLMGGRGSDLLLGGAGDDLLISRSDTGEQRIGQLAIGEPTRGDPDGEVDRDRQKLSEYLDQPLVGDDILVGGEGKDTFLFTGLINGKEEILRRNADEDGDIDWTMHGVAGENNELHDHWVDNFGIDVVADYDADEDHIAVIGHTANIEIEHRDLDNDGDNESIISVYSRQGGGGGAHTEDLIGQVIVYGDEVNEDDVVTDAGVFYGIVDNVDQMDEAVDPQGELKTSTGRDGETIFGYDTRDANGNDGEVTGNPQNFIDNPFLDEVTFSDPSDQSANFSSREPFEQQGFTEGSHDNITGTNGNDVLSGDPRPAPSPGDGLPGALVFHTFDNGTDGVFQDLRGGPEAAAYTLFENQALLQVQTPTRAGPDGAANTALEFNGEDSFGFIAHDDALEVTQGTVSLWIQPDDLSHDAIILSKDQSGTVDGGHFRLGIEDGGRIFLRFAEGDGGSNKAWVSSKEYFKEGVWTHVAVSFTEDGITVYADGVAVPDYAWIREEGNLDSPALASEAYILQNQEPWILGADTSRTHFNETAAEFATDEDHLRDPFDGAIADFGFWGGFTPQSALDAEQVLDLFVNGPGTALTAPAGPQPMLAGNDTIDGGDGNDVINGDAGNDELLGGNGEDSLMGGHGDDVLDGGAGNDVLQGGRGADLLIGGDGDDLLVSRSDAGEQRIGQLAIGEPTRGDPDNEVNPERQKLYGWEDQPLIADDILVGGDGADTFLFNPQINAKRDIILEHVNDDRTIDWAGVAGENNELHDHWVDNFGIDVIADYNAAEDTIAIIGHTVNPQVEYKLIDTDGDGIEDEAISVISVYSNQGGGGGAHTQDLIGQIVVHGDLVDPDNIVREAGVTHGIVETVDELQEALAPSGQLKVSLDENGNKVFGYDTRDAEGNLGLITANPEDHIDNPFLDDERFDFATNVPDGTPEPVAVIDALSHPALGQMVFTGNPDDGQGVAGSAAAFFNIPHEDQAAGLAQTTGTFAFNFTADSPGGSKQTLFSKDASGYVDGGHLTAWVTADKHLLVRYQSTDETVYLQDHDNHVEAGQSHHFAFSFDGTTAKLFVDGELRDTEDLSESSAFANGMFANTESLVFGAGTTTRTSGQLNNLKEFFDGNIEDVVVLNRGLFGAEAFKLANGALTFLGSSAEPAELSDDPTDPPDAEVPTKVEGLDLTGTRAADTLTGNSGDDTILGLEGVDIIQGHDGDDALDGGAHADVIAGGAGNDDIIGGAGDDRIEGDAGDDTIDAGLGDDTVDAGDGNDIVDGGSGADTIAAAEGNDRVDGGNGHDEITGGLGDDELHGQRGNDRISGDEGNDIIAGGRGRDQLAGGDGEDDLSGGRGSDSISGGDGVDQLRGEQGRDNLSGDDGNDVLRGEGGRDLLDGGNDSDILDGGRGHDTLVGGAGNDVLIGGGGRDNFVFESLEPGMSLGLDVIRDFRSGRDSISVSPDLLISLSERDGFTRMLLRNQEGDKVGEVEIFGTSVEESDILI